MTKPQNIFSPALARKLTTAYAVGLIAAVTTLAVDENPTRSKLAEAFLWSSGCIACSLGMIRPAQVWLNRSANKPLDP